MTPEPKVIKIGAGNREYVKLLGGPPDSVVMHSGAVTLLPGETVGRHTTAGNEELLIPLEGTGSLILGDSRELKLCPGNVLYCPPETEHDVRNMGSAVLRYIYVTARTK